LNAEWELPVKQRGTVVIGNRKRIKINDSDPLNPTP
jgi:hypothetical protein